MHGKRICGAKTRSGQPCQSLPCVGRTRCRMHGGASLLGIASPRFKHGRYSKHHVSRLAGKIERGELRVSDWVRGQFALMAEEIKQ